MSTTMTAQMKKTTRLAEGAVMLAFATVLSLIQIIPMPYGGTVTLFSMVPILIFSYRHGTKWGLAVAMLHGLIQLFLGLKNFSYAPGAMNAVVIALFDYIFAFGVLGFGSMFKNKKPMFSLSVTAILCVGAFAAFTTALLFADGGRADLTKNWWIYVLEFGIFVVLFLASVLFRKKIHQSGIAVGSAAVLACCLRMICHFISGITVWTGYAPNGAAVAYSLSYNLSYMIPETIITVIGLISIFALVDFDSPKLDMRLKKSK